MNRNIDHLIIHCSATKAGQNFTATDIDRWHREKGWWGCGYHYVITRDGRVQSAENGDRCRPLDKAGAHVGDCGPGWNARSIAICMVGGVGEDGKAENNFTQPQYDSLEGLVATLVRKMPSITHIGGHRDLIRKTKAPPKDCPSFDVKKWYLLEVTPFYEGTDHIQFL